MEKIEFRWITNKDDPFKRSLLQFRYIYQECSKYNWETVSGWKTIPFIEVDEKEFHDASPK